MVSLLLALEGGGFGVPEPQRIAKEAAEGRAAGRCQQFSALAEHSRDLLELADFLFLELALRGVEGGGAGQEAMPGSADVGLKALRLDKFVLAAREEVGEVVKKRARLGELLIEVEFELLHALTEEYPDIGLVEEPPMEVPLAEDLIAVRMERHDARLGGEPRQARRNPLLHFGGGLVGVSQGQKVFRRETRDRFEQMNDARGDDAGLAASWPSDDK